MTIFKIKDIRANPFRNLDNYPISRKKVDMLRESLQATGFWDNVVARLGEDGLPEIAYGHHRLAALREEYPPDHEVNLIIKDLDNDAMLKIMARENMDEYGSNAMIDMETVRATLDAYTNGKIQDMPQPPTGVESSNTGYASQVRFTHKRQSSVSKPYTAFTIAEYLGWTIKGKDGQPDHLNRQKASIALRALELIDDGVADLEDFEGFNVRTQGIVVQHARNAETPEVAQQIFQLAKNITKEGGGFRDIDREIKKENLAEPTRERLLATDANLSLLRVAMILEKIFDAGDKTHTHIRSAINRNSEIEPDTITRLDQVLNTLLTRTQELLDTLHGK